MRPKIWNVWHISCNFWPMKYVERPEPCAKRKGCGTPMTKDNRGEQGVPGVQGVPGSQGVQGNRGIQGVRGETGPADERGEVREALIAGLAASAGELSSVARELTAATRVGRAERIIIGALSLFLVVLSVVSYISIHKLQDIGKTNRSNTDLIVDCTTPGGVCYERGRKSTGSAIATINDVTIAASYCAQFNTTQATIRKCIEAELAKG